MEKREKFIIFGAPQICDQEINEVIDSLKSGWIGTGPKVARFEENFRNYVKAPNAAAVNSCTAALHLSLIAAGVGSGDEVITTPLTFCATINAIIHAGAKPVLADIDPKTLNINPDEVRRRITDKTKAILPVHFAGRPCEMDELVKIAQQNNLIIIEDCAHAIETEYKGRKMGSFGEFGCFSFYVTKNLITGEGGMVVTSSEMNAAKIKMLALHGMTKDAWKRFSDEGYKHYYVDGCGYKYNMTDLQAAIGIHQLNRIEENWLIRENIWNYYNEKLSNLPLSLPPVPASETRHSYHLYTVQVNSNDKGITRDKFLTLLTQYNIGVGVHYLSIAEHPFYQREFGWKANDFPIAKKVGRETVSLPISPLINNDDLHYIVSVIDYIFK